MPSFPTLAQGNTVQYPWTRRREYNNCHVSTDHGWRYSRNALATPLMSWSLEYPALSDADVSTLKAFWQARGGAYEAFTFTDPETSTAYTKCRFAGDEFVLRRIGPNHNSLTLAIQEYA